MQSRSREDNRKRLELVCDRLELKYTSCLNVVTLTLAMSLAVPRSLLLHLMLALTCYGRSIEVRQMSLGGRTAPHRSARGTLVQQGGFEDFHVPIAIPRNNPGDIVEVNVTGREDFGPRRLAGGTLAPPPTTMVEMYNDTTRHHNGSRTSAKRVPQQDLPSQACTPKLKAKKISYLKGCTGRLELAVCEGVCSTKVKLTRSTPFFQIEYSVCKLVKFEVVTIRVHCKSARSQQRSGAEFVDLRFRSAIECACSVP